MTHTLAGGLLAEMGLRERSRFAFAACLLGANAPDIDVFAPSVLPVSGIAFHRGPVHAVFAWPVLAAGIVAILWLADRLKPRGVGTLPFRPRPLFFVAFLAVLTHPFLDWLTTYAIAIFAPVSWRWYSGDAIFIVDWVYWLLMIAGIGWSAPRWRRKAPNAGRPAQIAGMLMLGYIAFNLGESARVEQATAATLRAQGLQPTLVVASPPPILFWRRTVAWRTADGWGRGDYDLARGLRVHLSSQPLGLDDPLLAQAKASSARVRGFLVWSRMPVVVDLNGERFLTDQRYYDPVAVKTMPGWLQGLAGRHPFLVPLAKGPAAEE